MRLLVLFSIHAAARGFGAVPHAEPAEEYPCRNKETPVFVAHAELIADCVASGIASEMECTSELAGMQTADSVGCGPEPEHTSRTSINTAPSALCDCCSIEVVPPYKDTLCNITEVAEKCAFTCGGMGVDNMMSLTEKIAIRKYKAENIDGGASTETSFCSLVGAQYNWPCANPGGRRLFDAAPAAPAKCEDAAADVVAALAAELSLSYGSCAELRAAGECDLAVVKKHCSASCGACSDVECEDAADELVAKVTEEVLGHAIASCVELKGIVGACEREAAKKHCPASCGLCDSGVEDRAAHRRSLGKCI